MNSIISSAIEKRQVLEFHYDGGIRIVEPFCYGISTAGNEVLRGYQTGGYSKSGRNSWKMFRVNEISSITHTTNTFVGNRPHYNTE